MGAGRGQKLPCASVVARAPRADRQALRCSPPPPDSGRPTRPGWHPGPLAGTSPRPSAPAGSGRPPALCSHMSVLADCPGSPPGSPHVLSDDFRPCAPAGFSRA